MTQAVANWFVARGWALIAVFRRCRGGLEGVADEGASAASRSEARAPEFAERALDNIEAVTPALIAQPFVDGSSIAVGGHGRGGALSVAWSGKRPEGRAVVNFVGGWVNRTCRYGRVINLNLLKRGVTWGQPSLWLYGERDLYLSLEDTKANFDTFLSAGGKAVWHDYKPQSGTVMRSIICRKCGPPTWRPISRNVACRPSTRTRVMCGCPVDARDFLTAPAMIGCGHVSGLEVEHQLLWVLTLVRSQS